MSGTTTVNSNSLFQAVADVDEDDDEVQKTKIDLAIATLLGMGFEKEVAEIAVHLCDPDYDANLLCHKKMGQAYTFYLMSTTIIFIHSMSIVDPGLSILIVDHHGRCTRVEGNIA